MDDSAPMMDDNDDQVHIMTNGTMVSNVLYNMQKSVNKNLIFRCLIDIANLIDYIYLHIG